MGLAGVRVLVVDDDRDTLDVVCFYLQRQGASVVCVEEASAALQAIELRPPDVLLSDLAMPGHDGLWLIRQVRRIDERRGGHLPAAAVSAHSGGAARDEALAAGFDLFVPKPVFPDRLVATVETLARDTAPRT